MRRSAAGRLARLIALGATAFALAIATSSAALADGGYGIRIERIDTLSYPTVRIVASVVDAAGKPVPGLSAGDVALTEDGIALPARVDLASETAPVALAFVLDSSGSMANGALQEAVSSTAAMTGRLAPHDYAAVITFRDTVDVVQGLTTDKAAAAAAARRILPDTAPLASWETFDDALARASALLATSPAGTRGAIVLVTDGFAASSAAADKATAIAQARASLYPIYAVAVGAQLDRETFQAIADASGGEAFFAPTPGQLAAAYSQLSEQILTQYSVTYLTGQLGTPGEGRTVRLQILRAGEVVAENTFAYSVPVFTGAVGAPAPTAVVLGAGQSITVTGTQVSTQQNAAAAAAAIVPAVSGDPAVVIAVLGAAASLSLFMFVVNGLLPGAALLRQRLDRFVVERSPIRQTEHVQSRRARMLRGLLTRTGSALAKVTPGAMLSSMGPLLEHAGSPFGLGPVEFLGVRAIVAVVAAAAGLAGGLSQGMGILGGTLIALAGLLVGYVLPVMVLRQKAAARKKAILRVLPSTVDILSLSVEAGLAFDGAIAQVVMRRRNPLADEFRRVLVEFQMGRGRRESLRELVRRCDVPEVGRMTNAVMQADVLGAPLGKVLSDLAVEMRTRRRQRAEELARTAPIKMLFPMVGLIFPALFIVILGPAVPRLMSLFSQVGH